MRQIRLLLQWETLLEKSGVSPSRWTRQMVIVASNSLNCSFPQWRQGTATETTALSAGAIEETACGAGLCVLLERAASIHVPEFESSTHPPQEAAAGLMCELS